MFQWKKLACFPYKEMTAKGKSLCTFYACLSEAWRHPNITEERASLFWQSFYGRYFFSNQPQLPSKIPQSVRANTLVKNPSDMEGDFDLVSML